MACFLYCLCSEILILKVGSIYSKRHRNNVESGKSFWGQLRNKSYSELGDGTVESKELIGGSIWAILCFFVVSRTEQVLPLVVGPCLECLSTTDIWGKEEA